MGHGGAGAAALGTDGAHRRQHHPIVGRAAMADHHAAPDDGADLRAAGQRDRLGTGGVQPHLQRPVPGGGKTLCPLFLPQLIGRARRTADAARRLRHHAAARQHVDEGPLRGWRPTRRAPAQHWDGGEVEKGHVGHAGEAIMRVEV